MMNRKAVKDHTCSLCFLPIPKGETYKYETLTPWGHPDNDSFGEFKAHMDCEEKWQEIAWDCDWILPQDKYDWLELIT
jgi:hypothetical protein